MRNRHTIQRNPVTVAGAGSLSFVGLLNALGANPKLIAILSAVLAVATTALRDLTKPGGSTVIVPTIRALRESWHDMWGDH